MSSEDHAGIYANSKMVSSSITTSDGGTSAIQGEVNAFLPADYSTSEGTRSVQFGQKVRLASDYIVDDFGSADGTQTVANGQIVRLADDYGTAGFTTDSGKRLLQAGDNVEVADGYDALLGTVGAVYQYLGTQGRVDLGVQDYTDTNLWKLVAGEAGSAYRYIGSTPLSGNLGAQDYTNTALWTKLAGAPGTVYQYMGTTASLDLGTQDYTDLRYWKAVPATQMVPQGNNISDSDSVALGGLVVRNDVRSDVEAYISNATVTARQGGAVYEYIDVAATRDLGAQNYGDLGLWKRVPETQIVPQGNNINDSEAMALGGMLVRNDVRADAAPTSRATLSAAAWG